MQNNLSIISPAPKYTFLEVGVVDRISKDTGKRAAFRQAQIFTFLFFIFSVRSSVSQIVWFSLFLVSFFMNKTAAKVEKRGRQTLSIINPKVSIFFFFFPG